MYGVEVLSLGYADQVGLFLNIPRLRTTNAVAVYRGQKAAASTGNLPDSWFDASVLYPEQASEVACQENLARSMVKAARKKLF